MAMTAMSQTAGTLVKTQKNYRKKIIGIYGCSSPLFIVASHIFTMENPMGKLVL
jgi:hypothetical protein